MIRLLMFFLIRVSLDLLSLTLNKKFGDALGALDYPQEEEIVDDRTVSATRVHWGYFLELFCEKYLLV